MFPVDPVLNSGAGVVAGVLNHGQVLALGLVRVDEVRVVSGAQAGGRGIPDFSQAAFFAGEHPQAPVAPPQDPRSARPLTMTPMAIIAIKAARNKAVTRTVCMLLSNVAGSFATPKRWYGAPLCLNRRPRCLLVLHLVFRQVLHLVFRKASRLIWLSVTTNATCRGWSTTRCTSTTWNTPVTRS